MNLHTEVHLEDEICEHLAESGWLHDAGDATEYDRDLALFPADVLAWVQQTQPQAWDALTKNHGASAGVTLLRRLRDSLDRGGTLQGPKKGKGVDSACCPLPLFGSALEVGRKFNSEDLVHLLTDLFAIRGVSEFIRCDNGPEFIAKRLRTFLERIDVGASHVEQGVPGKTATSKVSTVASETSASAARSSRPWPRRLRSSTAGGRATTTTVPTVPLAD